MTRSGDRVLLAALSRLLPRECWSSVFVTLATVLRLDREAEREHVDPAVARSRVDRRYGRIRGS